MTTSFGPISILRTIVRRLRCSCDTPWAFSWLDGSQLRLLDGDDKQWKHDLRGHLRWMVWNEKEFQNRLDMIGATPSEIDYECTVRLLRASANETRRIANSAIFRRRRKLPPKQIVHLRTVLCGAVYSQDRLFRAGKVSSNVCPYCEQSAETTIHILWECPCWLQQRVSLLDKFPLDPLEALPTCTKNCGIIVKSIPLQDQQRFAFADLLQRTFVNILTVGEERK